MKPRRLKRAVIKEELVSLTGDYISALILNQMLYWTERVGDFDRFLLETKERQANLDIELQHGWIYKNAKELSEEIMLGVSHQTIRRYMQALIDAGFLNERHNPKNSWDRTMQYRVDIVQVVRELEKIGYTLEGYTWAESSIVQNGQCKIHNGQSNVQNGDSSIYTEITTETTTSDQGEGSKIVAAPAPNGKAKLLSDSYDLPPRQSAPPPPTVASAPPAPRRVTSPHFDPRKLRGGFIPAGEGANPIEIYFERFSASEHKLNAPAQDDLMKVVTDLARWRQAVTAWQQSGHKPGNIKGMLDWYREGVPEKNRGASNGKSNHSGGSNGRHDRPVAPPPTARAVFLPVDPDDPY